MSLKLLTDAVCSEGQSLKMGAAAHPLPAGRPPWWRQEAGLQEPVIGLLLNDTLSGMLGYFPSKALLWRSFLEDIFGENYKFTLKGKLHLCHGIKIAN